MNGQLIFMVIFPAPSCPHTDLFLTSVTRMHGFMWLLIRLLLITMLTSQASADDRKDAFASGVMSSAALLQRGKVCFAVSSFMIAGDFFKGLQYIKKHSAADSADEF